MRGHTMASTETTPALIHTAPVSAKDRYESLDVLRGLAVMGILMVNAPFFMMYYGAGMYPLAHMSVEGANGLSWLIMHVFFEQKFVTLFSCLFGAGIMLMVGDEPDASRRVHFSRMRWLLVIGLIHGFAVWYGDILTPYAICGMLVVLMRRLSVAKLFLFGIIGILLTNALIVVNALSTTVVPEALEPTKFGIVPDAWTLELWVGAYQDNFWMSRLINAIANLIVLISQLISFAPRILGVMLIGMALYKTGFLLARWSVWAYALGALVTLVPGLGVLWWAGSANLAAGVTADTQFVSQSVNGFVSLVVAFGYACVIMLVCKAPWLKLLRFPLASAGRMAFTNYLTQSIVMVTLAVGFGMFGTLERIELVQLVATIWVAQLVISPIWLAVFRFGPMEWIWRSLSYGKFQPLFRARG